MSEKTVTEAIDKAENLVSYLLDLQLKVVALEQEVKELLAIINEFDEYHCHEPHYAESPFHVKVKAALQKDHEQEVSHE